MDTITSDKLLNFLVVQFMKIDDAVQKNISHTQYRTELMTAQIEVARAILAGIGLIEFSKNGKEPEFMKEVKGHHGKIRDTLDFQSTKKMA